MRKLYIIGLIAVALLVIGVAIAEEIIFSTYYPAPAGRYREFSTTGRTTLATNEYGIEDESFCRVGIGTTSPKTKLQVIGAIRAGSSSDATSTVLYSGTSESGSPAGYGDGFRIKQANPLLSTGFDTLVFEKTDGNHNDPDGGIAFVNTGMDGIEETAMVVKGNGNVGIGTTNPLGKLTIRDDSDPSFPCYMTIQAHKDTGSMKFLGSSDGFHFDTGDPGGENALLIRQNGDVGIGTTNPQAKLHVNGDIEIENPPSGSGNKNPVRGVDFSFTDSLTDYGGTPDSWTNAGQTLSLPEAGTYLVIYNARGSRSGGTRGDLSKVRLSTTTAGQSKVRAIGGIWGDTSQSLGNVTLIHAFTVSGSDTVNVQVKDEYGGAIGLGEATFTYIRIG